MEGRVQSSKLDKASPAVRGAEEGESMIFSVSRTKKNEEAATQAAFESEALVHMQTLYNAALYMTRSPGGAEDLVQETFLKAFRFWHRYEQGTNCKAWLFRILTNTFINRNRRKKRIHVSMDASDYELSSEVMAEKSNYYDSPEKEYLSKLFPEHVRDAIEALPESFRIPVVLADLHDFSYKEIADIMECPVGTVMSRLFRGRKRLQEALFEYAVELGVISASKAKDEETGAVSLDAYRSRKKAATA
ncbi:MAG: RNA polymerase sigma-70 factor (ECF subfamily) [Myxococcota bacterium]|jgi:RNA polymerase sigma-70 factor (ECF subfamily)